MQKLENLKKITAEGLALALDLQSNGHKDDALIVLQADMLTVLIHIANALEELSDKLDKT